MISGIPLQYTYVLLFGLTASLVWLLTLCVCVCVCSTHMNHLNLALRNYGLKVDLPLLYTSQYLAMTQVGTFQKTNDMYGIYQDDGAVGDLAH